MEDQRKGSAVVDSRSVVLGKKAAAERVGGGEDGGHRRCGGGERSREGRRSGRGEVRGKRTTEGRKLLGNTFISFSSQLSTWMQNTNRNNSTIPLALRTSVSQPCPSLNTASPATKQAASCILKGPCISKDREGKENRGKNDTPASLVANITPRSFRAVVI